MENNGIIVVKNDQKIIKINKDEYLYKKDFTAKITGEEKQKIQERLESDIKKLQEELKNYNEENYNKAIKEMELKSEENLKEYKDRIANIDKEMQPETPEEIAKRKEETLKELNILVEHHADATKLAKDKLENMYKSKVQTYANQLEEQIELLKLYKESE